MKPERNLIDQHKQVKEFLDEFRQSTRSSYKVVIKKYFDCIGEDPSTYLIDPRKLENGKKIDLLDKYESDIRKFNRWLSEKYSPGTISSYIVCVKKFLEFNHIELSHKFFTDLNRRGQGNAPVVKQVPVTKSDLRKILQHASSVKDRALILTLASSGARIGEVLSLTLNDIKMLNLNTKDGRKTCIYQLSIDKSKTKQPRTVFTSSEATLALHEWLKVREKYIIESSGRANALMKYIGGTPKSENDNRVFPFSQELANQIWVRLLKKAKLYERDTSTGRATRRVHGLRYFFRTQLSKCDRDFAECLMGHKDMSNHYYHKSEEEIKQLYIVYMGQVEVFDKASNPDMLNQVQQYEKQIAKLQYQIKEMQEQNRIEALNKEREGKAIDLAWAVKILKENGINPDTLSP